MTMSSIMARFVALVGGVALQWRKLQGEAPAPAWGGAPVVPVKTMFQNLSGQRQLSGRGISVGEFFRLAAGMLSMMKA